MRSCEKLIVRNYLLQTFPSLEPEVIDLTVRGYRWNIEQTMKALFEESQAMKDNANTLRQYTEWNVEACDSSNYGKEFKISSGATECIEMIEGKHQPKKCNSCVNGKDRASGPYFYSEESYDVDISDDILSEDSSPYLGQKTVLETTDPFPGSDENEPAETLRTRALIFSRREDNAPSRNEDGLWLGNKVSPALKRFVLRMGIGNTLMANGGDTTTSSSISNADADSDSDDNDDKGHKISSSTASGAQNNETLSSSSSSSSSFPEESTTNSNSPNWDTQWRQHYRFSPHRTPGSGATAGERAKCFVRQRLQKWRGGKEAEATGEQGEEGGTGAIAGAGVCVNGASRAVERPFVSNDNGKNGKKSESSMNGGGSGGIGGEKRCQHSQQQQQQQQSQQQQWYIFFDHLRSTTAPHGGGSSVEPCLPAVPNYF